MSDIEEVEVPPWLPMAAYDGLQYGPNFNPQGRESSSAAVDGTAQQLRRPSIGSPFTFRIVPPDILVDSLLGKGGPRTRDVFDPYLRQVFDEAVENLNAVLEAAEAGNTSPADVEAARLAVLGGRPRPTNNQGVGTLEAAMRSSSNFDRVLERRRNYRESKFFPSSQVQGDGLTYYEDLVARNGERFDPSRAQQSTANQPAFSDLQQAVSAINQLNRALLTPALTLMVNPETLTITYGKKQVYTDRNRFNYIFQSWGEEQPRLSITGKSAGFVVGSRDGRISDFGSTGFGTQETASVSGYQYASKWDSAAWQNLMTLFAFYRNNGYIYDTAGRPKSEAHLFIGNVEISYDQWVYIGNFENFQYSYEETKQHGAVEFSFEFVVSFMYDRGQQQSVVRPWPGVTPSPGTLPPTTPAPPPLPGARTTREQETPNLAGGSTALLSDGIDPFAPRTGPGSGPFGLPPGSVPFF